MSAWTLYCRPTLLRKAIHEAEGRQLCTPEQADAMRAALRGLTHAAYVSTSSQYAEFARCEKSAVVLDLAICANSHRDGRGSCRYCDPQEDDKRGLPE